MRATKGRRGLFSPGLWLPWSLVVVDAVWAQGGVSFTRRDVEVGRGPASVTVGDFNEDGHQDLATPIAPPNAGSISIRLGRGDGTFQAAPGVPVEATGSITVGDFNEDGRQDLATVTPGAGSVTILINSGVVVNDLVTFDQISSTFHFTPDPAGCPEGFVGTFSFEARLTNTSESSLTDLVVGVTTLTNGNLLQNADGGPGGVGVGLTVPRQR